MKKSFWDLIKQDLEKSPPETLNFINNIKELINTIIGCVPNKVEYREEINRVIDVELIDQMIKHNAYRYDDLVKVVEYVNESGIGMIETVSIISTFSFLPVHDIIMAIIAR